MKNLVAILLIATSPALVMAQQAAPAAPAKPASKPVMIKKRGGQQVPKTAEEAKAIDDDPAHKLSPEELETAKMVHTGEIRCELGATVHVTPHKREGFFIVRTGIQRFRMHPVGSRTGAIRLEDPVAGAMWLQLANKSMLMSQKMGRRLADECMSPGQAAVAEALKKKPAPSILDQQPAAAAKPASAPVTSAAAPAPTAAAVAPAAAAAPAASATK
jgi:hypothetical protein